MSKYTEDRLEPYSLALELINSVPPLNLARRPLRTDYSIDLEEMTREDVNSSVEMLVKIFHLLLGAGVTKDWFPIIEGLAASLVYNELYKVEEIDNDCE
jgi:hypothetical protein